MIVSCNDGDERYNEKKNANPSFRFNMFDEHTVWNYCETNSLLHGEYSAFRIIILLEAGIPHFTSFLLFLLLWLLIYFVFSDIEWFGGCAQAAIVVPCNDSNRTVQRNESCVNAGWRTRNTNMWEKKSFHKSIAVGIWLGKVFLGVDFFFCVWYSDRLECRCCFCWSSQVLFANLRLISSALLFRCRVRRWEGFSPSYVWTKLDGW